MDDTKKTKHDLPDELGLDLLDGVLGHLIRGRDLVGELLLILGPDQHLVHLPVAFPFLTGLLAAASVRGEWSGGFAACEKKEMEM